MHKMNIIANAVLLSNVLEEIGLRLSLPLAIITEFPEDISQLINFFIDPVVVTTSDPFPSIRKSLTNPMLGPVIVHVKSGFNISAHERNVLLRLQSAAQTGYIWNAPVVNSPIFLFEVCIPDGLQSGFCAYWFSRDTEQTTLPVLSSVSDDRLSKISMLKTQHFFKNADNTFTQWLTATAFLLCDSQEDFQKWEQSIAEIVSFSRDCGNEFHLLNKFMLTCARWMKQNSSSIFDEKNACHITPELFPTAIIKRGDCIDLGHSTFCQIINALPYPPSFIKRNLMSSGILMAQDHYLTYIYLSANVAGWVYRIRWSPLLETGE